MIRCEHLVKRYSNVVAVNDLNLDIIPGQIYALIGPNGSGKSTFMKMLGGITKPTSGAITLDGRPISYKDKAQHAYRKLLLQLHELHTVWQILSGFLRGLQHG